MEKKRGVARSAMLTKRRRSAVVRFTRKDTMGTNISFFADEF